MKIRNIILVMSLLLCAGSAATQVILEPGLPVAPPRFFDETRTFYGNGFVYQADVEECGRVTLYNRDAGNFVGAPVPQTHRDGSLICGEDRRRYGTIVWDTYFLMRDLAERIVIEAFSSAERLRLNNPEPGEYLGLRLIICSDTGNVKEVHFRFFNDDAFATIPVSTYRRIEVAIKEQVRFTPTDFGRSLNFIFHGRLIEIPFYFKEEPDSPPPGPGPGPGPGTGIGDGGGVGPAAAPPPQE
jgi:hypothetical protein